MMDGFVKWIKDYYPNRKDQSIKTILDDFPFSFKAYQDGVKQERKRIAAEIRERAKDYIADGFRWDMRTWRDALDIIADRIEGSDEKQI